jgi:hypothetical protein
LLFNEHVSSDGLLPALPDLDKLGGQALDKVLKPTGHIHAAFPDVLNCSVEGPSIPIVKFADREHPLEADVPKKESHKSIVT